MWLCSSSTSIIEDRDSSTHLDILTIRDAAHAPVLAAQIHDHPAALPLPDVLEAQPCHFFAAQSAADHDGQHGAVASALQSSLIRTIDESFGLALGKPVSGPGAFELGAADV